MEIKCFSKRKLNVRKIQFFTNLQPFNFNLQQDLKIVALIIGKIPKKIGRILATFSKTSAIFWQILQHFVKNQQKNQQFLTKKLRLESGIRFQSGAKECIV